jgi:hypothetical protein
VVGRSLKIPTCKYKMAQSKGVSSAASTFDLKRVLPFAVGGALAVVAAYFILSRRSAPAAPASKPAAAAAVAAAASAASAAAIPAAAVAAAAAPAPAPAAKPAAALAPAAASPAAASPAPAAASPAPAAAASAPASAAAAPAALTEADLFRAALHDNAEEVQRAAAAGVNVSCFDAFGGDTPLHWAAGNGRVQAVAALLAAGAAVNAKSKKTAKSAGGATPLDYAKQSNMAEAAAALVKAGGLAGSAC